MTTPTYYPLNRTLLTVKSEPQGVVSEAVSVNVSGTVGSTTFIGLIPFQKGFSLNTLNLSTVVLSSATTLTADVGYVYDDNTTYTNDTDYFAADITTYATSGAVFTYPSSAASLNIATPFVAEASGWIGITTKVGATTTVGTIPAVATFNYNPRP